MSLVSCIYVVIGGALGTFARYAISVAALPISRQLPWGTIVVNVTGCAIIGFVGTLTLANGRYPLSENMRLFWMVGVCGGYTTFSAFSLQTLDLLRAGAAGRALFNVAASVVLCVCAVAAGHFLAAHWNGDAQRIAQAGIEEDA
jgi:CrcB protein